MRTFVIILTVVIIISVTAFLLMRKKENAIVTKERSVYNGLTRSEFVLKLQQAWKDKWLAVTKNYILTEEAGREWRTAIETEMSKQGIAPANLEKEIELAALSSWATVQPKAWTNKWSQGWLGNYAKNTMLVDTKNTDILQVLQSI